MQTITVTILNDDNEVREYSKAFSHKIEDCDLEDTFYEACLTMGFTHVEQVNVTKSIAATLPSPVFHKPDVNY